MSDKDFFDFINGLFYGLDYNSDAQYQKSLQEIRNRQDIPENYKNCLVENINAIYYQQKEQIKKGKQVVDFSKCIYNLINNPPKNNNFDQE